MENKKTKLGLRLFIDDIREAPEGWTLVTTVTEAIKFINRYQYEIDAISIDHDISYPVTVNGLSRPYPSPETFQAVALYIDSVYSSHMEDAPIITIHSANPVGAKQIDEILMGFTRSIKPYEPATRRAL